jgi:glycosyltransferase involved in cell wall biosynthesis
MASGIPCITTWVSGTKELVLDGETGYHFTSGSGAELGDAIRKAIPVARAMGATARERMVAHFSLGALAARYEDLYRQLLSEG